MLLRLGTGSSLAARIPFLCYLEKKADLYTSEWIILPILSYYKPSLLWQLLLTILMRHKYSNILFQIRRFINICLPKLLFNPSIYFISSKCPIIHQSIIHGHLTWGLLSVEVNLKLKYYCANWASDYWEVLLYYNLDLCYSGMAMLSCAFFADVVLPINP